MTENTELNRRRDNFAIDTAHVSGQLSKDLKFRCEAYIEDLPLVPDPRRSALFELVIAVKVDRNRVYIRLVVS